MKKIYQVTCCFLISIILSACTTYPSGKPNIASSSADKSLKDPSEIAFYPKGQKPVGHYIIIGKAIVSRVNTVGVKRQKAVINDHLRSIAAAMGGDGVMDISLTSDDVIGVVISYKKNSVSL